MSPQPSPAYALPLRARHHGAPWYIRLRLIFQPTLQLRATIDRTEYIILYKFTKKRIWVTHIYAIEEAAVAHLHQTAQTTPMPSKTCGHA